ncbi:TPA: hypothetical protein ACK1SE_002728 [Proteus mirabilis]
MSDPIQTQQVDFQAWMAQVLQQAHDIGYANGFEKGTAFGYALAMEHTKSAVSDGLRSGSSECGKNMRSRRHKS